jgi:hypothetical protein
MKNLYLIVVLFGALQGCAGIAQPVAKIDLVEEKSISNHFDDGLVSQNAWDALSHSGAGDSVTLKAQTARLGKHFFAASGKKCRQFYFEQDLVRIVCQDKDSEQWHFVRPVISEFVEMSKQE